MELRNYQEEIKNEAIEILNKYSIVYLAMEVRTGKTLTALSICKDLGFKNILFITKKKAISSIVNDSKLIPELNVICINYESVHKITELSDIVIVDEAHSLGAYPKPSLRTKNIKSIAKDKKIIYLSGTPSPESYSQLFHQFWISHFSPFKNYTNFYKWANDFVIKQKRYLYNREVTDYSNAMIEKIDFKTKHLFINFTQKEAGFEKRITEKVLYVEPDKNVKLCVNLILKNNIIEGKTGTIIADTAVKLQQKIHQIYSGSVKDEEGNIHILSNYKADFIKEYFKNQKIAIFYKFIGEFNILKDVFENCYTTQPEIFQTGEKSVFLGQFLSSREGIRLDVADCIIFYNIDFSYLSYEQAKNRIISKERIKEAVLYWIFAKDGIEQKIYNVVKNKSDYTTHYFKKDYGIKNTNKN